MTESDAPWQPWRSVAKKAILSAITVGLLPASGAVCEVVMSMRAEKTFPPPGRLVDVGGFRLHIHCTGEGAPTVILDSARATSSLFWSHVQPEVAKFTRVCSYDRAGLGWSDEGPQPRSAQVMLNELRTLLQNAGIPGPFVLVASSASGYQARLFASQFPAEVAGMVLIDPVSEDGASFMSKDESERQHRMIKTARLLAPLGVIRLVGEMGLSSEFEQLIEKFPEHVRGAVRAHYYRSRTWRVALAELAGDQQSRAQARAATHPPLVRPVVVISALRDLGDAVAKDQWLAQHQELARKLSLLGSHMVAENSGHLVQLDEPQLVVEAILRVVTDSATGGHP